MTALQNGPAAGEAVDRTPKSCHHKYANHRHGTPAAYALDLCRCAQCTAARTDYESNRVRQIAYGRWQPFRFC